MTLMPTLDQPEVEGLAVRWIMSDGKRNVVCWVRAAALEHLEDNVDLPKTEYMNAFVKHRDILEDRARDIFKRGKLDGNAVIVRKENI